MHVVIVGAGEVGQYLAQILAAEGHDIVVVERDARIAAKLSESLDIQVVVGSGSDPSSMAAAKTDKAELLAAVSDNDEVNLIASALAKDLGVPTRAVRLQQRSLRSPEASSLRELMGATVVMDPDSDTADEILELLHNTGADEIYPITKGGLSIVGATVAEGAALAGQSLIDIAKSFEPNWNFLFGAVTRDGKTNIPRGDQMILAGDHVRVICRESARADILNLLGVDAGKARRVMILGGGAIGGQLAERLQQDGVDVVVIEQDPDQALMLAEAMPGVTVILGDITDAELLVEEDVGRMDAVVAATGEDAANVLACALAAAEGTAFTIVVLHRLELLPLVRQFGIHAAISPRTASANSILRLVRGGFSVATFLESDIEVDEIAVQAGSIVCGREIKDMHFSHDILLGAVIHEDGTSEIVRGSTKLAANDHVVLFAEPEALSNTRHAFTAP